MIHHKRDSRRSPPAQPQGLRLFSGDGPGRAAQAEPADGEALSPGMTVSQFYFGYVRPIVLRERNAKPRNLQQYDGTVSYWSRFTGDPPLESIEDRHKADFAARLWGLKGRRGGPISQNTVRKHMIHLQAVLDLAGPRSRSANPRGADLLVEAPYLHKPATLTTDVENAFTLAEVQQWLAACRGAKFPTESESGVPAPLWWQQLGIFLYNAGPRIGTAQELRFSWLERDELGAWFRAPEGAVKGRRKLSIYVNPWALAAIETMRAALAAAGRGKQDRIFLWPHVFSWLNECRVRLLERSEIQPSRRFGFHALRKACATELGKMNFAAAKLQLGHASKDVTLTNYTHRVVLVETANRLPQPDWDAVRFQAGPRQLELF
jgi:integrase